jgi:hypothetical protein
MLTRRELAGFAPCAICGLTGLVATDASAQGAPPAATAGVTRKILSQTDGPTPGYVTINVVAEIEPGVSLRDTRIPESSLPMSSEGGFELPIQGQTTLMLKPGDGFQVPAETPMPAASPATRRRRSPSPMSWRRASRSRLQPDRIKTSGALATTGSETGRGASDRTGDGRADLLYRHSSSAVAAPCAWR